MPLHRIRAWLATWDDRGALQTRAHIEAIESAVCPITGQVERPLTTPELLALATVEAGVMRDPRGAVRAGAMAGRLLDAAEPSRVRRGHLRGVGRVLAGVRFVHRRQQMSPTATTPRGRVPRGA